MIEIAKNNTDVQKETEAALKWSKRESAELKRGIESEAIKSPTFDKLFSNTEYKNNRRLKLFWDANNFDKNPAREEPKPPIRKETKIKGDSLTLDMNLIKNHNWAPIPHTFNIFIPSIITDWKVDREKAQKAVAKELIKFYKENIDPIDYTSDGRVYVKGEESIYYSITAYLKDKNGIYFDSSIASWGGRIDVYKLEWIDDPSKFEALSRCYWTYENKVFFLQNEVKWADRATFHIIDKKDGTYAADKNNVYHHGVIVPWVDIATFKRWKHGDRTDKNRAYDKN